MVQDDPVVSSDAVAEAILRKLHGFNRVPIDEQERMIHRAVLAGRDAAQKEHAARIAALEAQLALEAERLNWLEAMANQKGGLLLHDGSETGRTGLGLRPGLLRRTLREAIDDARRRYDPPKAKE